MAARELHSRGARVKDAIFHPFSSKHRAERVASRDRTLRPEDYQAHKRRLEQTAKVDQEHDRHAVQQQAVREAIVDEENDLRNNSQRQGERDTITRHADQALVSQAEKSLGPERCVAIRSEVEEAALAAAENGVGKAAIQLRVDREESAASIRKIEQKYDPAITPGGDAALAKALLEEEKKPFQAQREAMKRGVINENPGLWDRLDTEHAGNIESALTPKEREDGVNIFRTELELALDTPEVRDFMEVVKDRAYDKELARLKRDELETRTTEIFQATGFTMDHARTQAEKELKGQASDQVKRMTPKDLREEKAAALLEADRQAGKIENKARQIANDAGFSMDQARTQASGEFEAAARAQADSMTPEQLHEWKADMIQKSRSPEEAEQAIRDQATKILEANGFKTGSAHNQARNELRVELAGEARTQADGMGPARLETEGRKKILDDLIAEKLDDRTTELLNAAKSSKTKLSERDARREARKQLRAELAGEATTQANGMTPEQLQQKGREKVLDDLVSKKIGARADKIYEGKLDETRPQAEIDLREKDLAEARAIALPQLRAERIEEIQKSHTPEVIDARATEILNAAGFSMDQARTQAENELKGQASERAKSMTPKDLREEKAAALLEADRQAGKIESRATEIYNAEKADARKQALDELKERADEYAEHIPTDKLQNIIEEEIHDYVLDKMIDDRIDIMYDTKIGELIEKKIGEKAQVVVDGWSDTDKASKKDALIQQEAQADVKARAKDIEAKVQVEIEGARVPIDPARVKVEGDRKILAAAGVSPEEMAQNRERFIHDAAVDKVQRKPEEIAEKVNAKIAENVQREVDEVWAKLNYMQGSKRTRPEWLKGHPLAPEGGQTERPDRLRSQAWKMVRHPFAGREFMRMRHARMRADVRRVEEAFARYRGDEAVPYNVPRASGGMHDGQWDPQRVIPSRKIFAEVAEARAEYKKTLDDFIKNHALSRGDADIVRAYGNQLMDARERISQEAVAKFGDTDRAMREFENNFAAFNVKMEQDLESRFSNQSRSDQRQGARGRDDYDGEYVPGSKDAIQAQRNFVEANKAALQALSGRENAIIQRYSVIGRTETTQMDLELKISTLRQAVETQIALEQHRKKDLREKRRTRQQRALLSLFQSLAQMAKVTA